MPSRLTSPGIFFCAMVIVTGISTAFPALLTIEQVALNVPDCAHPPLSRIATVVLSPASTTPNIGSTFIQPIDDVIASPLQNTGNLPSRKVYAV